MTNPAEIDYSNYTTAEMLTIYNDWAALTGSPVVKKFENRAAAIRRLTPLLGSNPKETRVNDSETHTHEEPFFDGEPEATDTAPVEQVFSPSPDELVDEDPTEGAEIAPPVAAAEPEAPEEEINTRVKKKTGRKSKAEKEALAAEAAAAPKAAKTPKVKAEKPPKAEKAPKAPKEPKAASDDPAGTRGRLASCSGKKLFSIKGENPRRVDSFGYHSHALYLANPGMTYEEYRSKGGRPQDLAWDLKHGHTRVE